LHSISIDVDATHAPTNNQMIWSTSYHHVTVLVHRSWPHLLFTVASVLRRQAITQLALHPSNRPSSQASSWSSPPWSHDSMSCLICNELLHDTITCGLISCVSHINTISPPKVVTKLPKPNKDLSSILVVKDCSLHFSGVRLVDVLSVCSKSRWWVDFVVFKALCGRSVCKCKFPLLSIQCDSQCLTCGQWSKKQEDQIGFWCALMF
jgi:hypothetical protein